MDVLKMDIIGVLSTAVLAIFVWIWLRNFNRKRIPGPIGFPIVGYLPFLTTKPYEVLQKLGHKYGPIFKVRMGSETVIVLNDFQTAKDAFAQEAFVGRPPVSPFDINKKTIDTGAFNDLPWKEQRRFSLQILRDLGFGKSHLEDMIKEEITELLDRLGTFEKQPSPIRRLITPSMSNNISCLVFGSRLPFDHPERTNLDRILADSTAAASQTAWMLFFPWLVRLLRFLKFGSVSKTGGVLKEFKEYCRKKILDHEKSLDPNNIRDFIDGYLLEIQKRKDPAFCKEVLEDLVGGFFGAGSETVRLTIEWLLLTMAAHPEVQKRVQAEIDETIGQSRLPTWTDHPRTPYTVATISELMRWKTIIPLNPLRYTLWDTELNGYFIPKHTCILENLWSIHHDKTYWGEDADEFRPERFLSEDGKEVQKHEQFIPFSVGKRSCPGESFARTEVFMYFSALIQKFEVSFPEDSVPDFDADLGIGLMPRPQNLRLRKRF